MKKLLLLSSCLISLSLNSVAFAETTTVSETSATEETTMADETTEVEETTSSTEEVNDKDPFDPASYETVFEADMYKIGKDMPAGEYKIIANEDYSMFELNGDARGEDYIASNSVDTFVYVVVEDGQYLTLSDCFAVPVEETWAVEPVDGKLPAGMYRVGTDIEPGEYKVVAVEDYASYQITEDANGEKYIDSNSIKKSHYIEVKDGEYLLISSAELIIEE